MNRFFSGPEPFIFSENENHYSFALRVYVKTVLKQACSSFSTESAMSVCLPDDVILLVSSYLPRQTFVVLTMASKHISKVLKERLEREKRFWQVVRGVWKSAREVPVNDPSVLEYQLARVIPKNTWYHDKQRQTLLLIVGTSVQFRLRLLYHFTLGGTFEDVEVFQVLMRALHSVHSIWPGSVPDLAEQELKFPLTIFFDLTFREENPPFDAISLKLILTDPDHGLWHFKNQDFEVDDFPHCWGGTFNDFGKFICLLRNFRPLNWAFVETFKRTMHDEFGGVIWKIDHEQMLLFLKRLRKTWHVSAGYQHY